ncbi:MAG: hypothetical protein HYU59_11630 [Magnetospirillum gryphiswaldense]|nr:hypothetical protein [Magnetospirillum gryphiswaldense]
MSIRGIGVLLIWIGTLLLVAVLQHRIRNGAWNAEALEDSPPLERWAVPVAVTGIVLAAIGAGMTMVSFL